MATTASNIFSSLGLPQEIDNTLRRNWWLFLLRGALAVAFGLICLFYPAAAILSLVLVFGAFALVDGFFAIGGAIRDGMQNRPWGFLLALGIISVLAGIAAFAWPGLTVFAFVILMATWAIAAGIVMIWAAFQVEQGSNRWWMLAEGILSALFGLLLIFAPMAGALVLTWWIGAYAIVIGIAFIAFSFSLRSQNTGTSLPQGAR